MEGGRCEGGREGGERQGRDGGSSQRGKRREREEGVAGREGGKTGWEKKRRDSGGGQRRYEHDSTGLKSAISVTVAYRLIVGWSGAVIPNCQVHN